MPGTLVQYTWQSNPTLYAPAKYKRACRYHAFVPEPTAALTFTIDSTLAGLAAEAEQSIRALNDSGSMALRPLARLLLRTESIASSKVEGLQLGIRALARAEARLEVGSGASETAIEVLSNIEAMVLAVHDASSAERFAVSDIIAIHQRLMEGAPNSRIAGLIRTQQNWIGGNDYNPCGADFVPPPDRKSVV